MSSGLTEDSAEGHSARERGEEDVDGRREALQVEGVPHVGPVEGEAVAHVRDEAAERVRPSLERTVGLRT